MKIIVAILAAAFFAGAAFVQSPARAAGSMAGSDSHANHGADVEKHINDMHAKLKITATEEAQWANVAQTMRDSASALDRAIEKRESIINSAPALDNLNAYGDVAQAHADGVKKLAAAFSPLYASMPDDQKKVADDVFAQRMHHKGKK